VKVVDGGFKGRINVEGDSGTISFLSSKINKKGLGSKENRIKQRRRGSPNEVVFDFPGLVRRRGKVERKVLGGPGNR